MGFTLSIPISQFLRVGGLSNSLLPPPPVVLFLSDGIIDFFIYPNTSPRCSHDVPMLSHPTKAIPHTQPHAQPQAQPHAQPNLWRQPEIVQPTPKSISSFIARQFKCLRGMCVSLGGSATSALCATHIVPRPPGMPFQPTLLIPFTRLQWHSECTPAHFLCPEHTFACLLRRQGWACPSDPSETQECNAWCRRTP